MHVLTAIIYTNIQQYVNYVYLSHLYNKYTVNITKNIPKPTPRPRPNTYTILGT